MAKKEEEILILEKNTANPELWKTPEKAKETLSKLESLKKEVNFWVSLKKESDDLLEMEELLQENQEIKDFEEDFLLRKQKLEKETQKNKILSKMQGEYDSRNAILSIHAGAGGADAQDWAEMLMRMYLRFCEKRNWETKITDESRGSEAGIKSADLEIKGKFAYGFLKSEKGVHRLIRLSPFNADHLRQTSFALIEIFPEIKDKEIEIKDSDLEISSFRSSGPGGQSVNTTDSAVRIKHKPTGIITTCQNERSQLQNRESALKILRAKLAELKEQQKISEQKEIKGKHISAEGGNQIRTYTLHPYKMVKDHRTGIETSNTEKVLEGELDLFLNI
ncbi:MAG: peptide chain release factor 2 [bacterium]